MGSGLAQYVFRGEVGPDRLPFEGTVYGRSMGDAVWQAHRAVQEHAGLLAGQGQNSAPLQFAVVAIERLEVPR